MGFLSKYSPKARFTEKKKELYHYFQKSANLNHCQIGTSILRGFTSGDCVCVFNGLQCIVGTHLCQELR